MEHPRYFLLWFAIGAAAVLTLGLFIIFTIIWFVAVFVAIATVPPAARAWPYPLGLPTGIIASVAVILLFDQVS